MVLVKIIMTVILTTYTSNIITHQRINICNNYALNSSQRTLHVTDGKGLNKVVYGFLTYWKKQNYYLIRWNLISHIALFGVEFGGHGQIVDYHEWPDGWSDIIDSAISNGVQVHLAFFINDSPNGDTIHYLLTHNDAMLNAVNNIKQLVNNTMIYGVNIDFEQVRPSDRSAFSHFIEVLHDTLRIYNKDLVVTLTNSINDSYDARAISNNSEAIFVMGYDYHWPGSQTSGPVAPIRGWGSNLTTTLTDYINTIGGGADKLILGVPYFGYVFPTADSLPGATVIDTIRAIEYQDAIVEAERWGIRWDTTSLTPWYLYRSNDHWVQVWFDDANSLSLKYDLADSFGLQGIGIWILTDDGARPELWEAIRDHFQTPPTYLNIPADTSYWFTFTCGGSANVGDTMRVYGTAYRAGGGVFSKNIIDLRNTDIYMKWKIHSGGTYLAIHFGANNANSVINIPFYTTDHSYNGSHVVNEDTWYYSHFHIIGDLMYKITTSTNNYDDMGGNIVVSSSYIYIDSLYKKYILPQARLWIMFEDNYGGTNCYMDIAEIKVKNGEIINREQEIKDSITYSFNDGQWPDEFSHDSQNQWDVGLYGPDSSYCIRGIINAGDTGYVSLQESDIVKVSFDVRYISGYTWHPSPISVLYLDSAIYQRFDMSNAGCWRHYWWYLPDDTLPHEIKWKILETPYPQGNPEIYLDNVKIYYRNVTGSNEPVRGAYVQITKISPNIITSKNVPVNISFSTLQKGEIYMEIYNSAGRKVYWRKLFYSPGNYSIRMQLNLPSGVYFLRIKQFNSESIKRIVILTE